MQKAAEQDSNHCVALRGLMSMRCWRAVQCSIYQTEDSPAFPCTPALKVFWGNLRPFHWLSVVVELATRAKELFVFLFFRFPFAILRAVLALGHLLSLSDVR